MKTDTYTKVILTLICIFLAVIALRPYLEVERAEAASGKFGHIEFAASGSDFYFFDTETGKLYEYVSNITNRHYGEVGFRSVQMTTLGQDMKIIE